HHPGEVARRGDRLDETCAVARGLLVRDPPAVFGRRLRARRSDRRTPRAGRKAPRGGRQAAPQGLTRLPPARRMDETQRQVEAVFRIEWARLVAGLARFVRGDLGAAEELAQDAFVAALETWPKDGIPREPGAWLMQVAKNRALKRVDRQRRWEKKETEIRQAMEARQERAAGAIDDAADDDVGDDLLRLIFASCHPSLSAESRVALTLRVLCGLTTEEIACAFVIPEATAAQR